jgi:catechol 2,3-dioxygenase-like lactoylglutathione lyase family enzyme
MSPRPGAAIRGVHHIGIPVSSLDRSLAFFEQAFGLLPLFVGESSGPQLSEAVGVPDAHSRVALIEAPGGVGIELLEYVNPRGRAHDRANNDIGASHLCLQVDHIDQAASALEAHGVEFLSAPMTATTGELAGWRFAYFTDPIDGVTFELIQAPTG